jgi:carbohydrate-selective porin OprB
MNLQNVEVMENTQKTNKNRFVPAVIGAGALIAASASNAAIDVSSVTTEIGGLAAPIAAIGAAILLIFVGLKGWKLIRRAM